MRVPTPKKIGPNNYRVRVFFQDPVSNKRRSITVRVIGGLAEARRVARALATLRDGGQLGKVDHEEYLATMFDQQGSILIKAAEVKGNATTSSQEPATPTLEEHLRAWLATRRVKRLAAKTRRDYTWITEKYLIPYLGEKALQDLDQATIEDFMDDVAALGLAPRTQKYILDVLRMGIESQVGKSWPKNPAREVASPSLTATQRVARSMNEHEARAYTDALSDDPLDLALHIALTTGARPGEVLALHKADLEVTRQGAYLTISRALDPVVDREVGLKAPKTGKQRRVAIPLEVGEKLRALSRGKAPGDLLIAQPGDRYFSVAALRERHNERLAAAGITRPYRLYDLRHTHASLLLRAGVSPFVVSKRLGHSTTSFTMDTYGHQLPNMQEEALLRLEDLLKDTTGD